MDDPQIDSKLEALRDGLIAIAEASEAEPEEIDVTNLDDPSGHYGLSHSATEGAGGGINGHFDAQREEIEAAEKAGKDERRALERQIAEHNRTAPESEQWAPLKDDAPVNAEAYEAIEKRTRELQADGHCLKDATIIAREEILSKGETEKPVDADAAYLGESVLELMGTKRRRNGGGGSSGRRRGRKVGTAPVCRVCGLQGCTKGCECEKIPCPECKYYWPKGGKKQRGRPSPPPELLRSSKRRIRLRPVVADEIEGLAKLSISDATEIFAISLRLNLSAHEAKRRFLEGFRLDERTDYGETA
jgi:hypothetical protein